MNILIYNIRLKTLIRNLYIYYSNYNLNFIYDF